MEGEKMRLDTLAGPSCMVMNRFQGEWVAISMGDVIDHSKDLDELVDRVEGMDSFVEFHFIHRNMYSWARPKRIVVS